MRRLGAALGAILAACGGGGDGPDAAADGGPAVGEPAPPAPPALTPCPPGWRAVDDGGVVVCDPWPEGGAATCAGAEAHFPGEPGCARVGAPCPAGEWPEGLPADRPIRHVRAGEAPGGDGSPGNPFGTIAEALVAPPPGLVVALGKGEFAEAVTVPGGVTVWGACVAETRVAAPTPSTTAGTFTIGGAGAAIRNLTVGGERPGVFVGGGARSVDVSDVIVAGALGAGVLVLGGAAALDSVVVRDTRPLGDGTFGRALDLELGGAASWRRGAAERNVDLAVIAMGAGTSLSLEDVAVRDTRARPRDGDFGDGVGAFAGAAVAWRRGAAEGSRALGVAAYEAGTSVTLEDVVVRDTLGRANDGTLGRGLGVQTGAVVIWRRGLAERNASAGIYASGDGTSVTLEDVVVRDTQGRASDGWFGRGLDVRSGAVATWRRGWAARNRELGVAATDPGTSLTLEDVVVRDTLGRRSDGVMGRGLGVQSGAVTTWRRGVAEGNRDVGVFAGLGARADLHDLVVRGTRRQECAAAGACAWDVATNVGAYGDAQLELTTFVVAESELVGVQLALGGTIDLHDGVVSGSPIAVNVQTEGFDVARLEDRVVYADNEINFDGSALPVPTASDLSGP